MESFMGPIELNVSLVPSNSSDFDTIHFAMDTNFARLLCSLVLVIFWVIYITYYHSRVLGFILTKIINRYLVVGNGFFHIGSFTWSVLSGKVMFRDVIYMTQDYTLRIQDGWLIFRWWRAYVPKDVSGDLSHSDTRLSIMLNGFEWHLYNRTTLYARLEKVFGLDSEMMNLKDETDGKEDTDESGALTSSFSKTTSISSNSWRDLIPVIKVDMSSGRVVFGNHLIPTTLSVNVDEAHFVYSTKPAASRLDHYMHFVKCMAENFKIILAPSPKYTGMVDDPPRYMGEGFVVVLSNKVDLYYYMDQPGVVPDEPEMLQLANGDIVESSPPIWGIDIKCGKGTHFSYGPWANRQREHLYKFFFPNDYQPMQVTKIAQSGERRQVQSFDIRLSTQNEATIDVLFTKNKETNAIHLNIEPGSYLEITLPWLVNPDGYTTKVRGQLLHVDASTSLLFRTLVEAETLEFNVQCHFPVRWNDHQDWVISLTGCKATVHLIYSHKGFFQDLVNDWASKSQPDLLAFVPYTWKFSLLLKEFEIITLTNNHNWIDCSSQNQENSLTAISGDLFDLSFDLPFTEFLPVTLPIRIWIQGESVDLLIFVPETSTSRSVLEGLEKHAKIIDRNGNIQKTKRDTQKKWRKICARPGWFDCCSVPIAAISITYIYHPQPPLGPVPQADITTPEKEELLLSPMRIPRSRKTASIRWEQPKAGGKKFNPTSLPADKVIVEVEIGLSVLMLYGTLLKHFLYIKDNIFGDSQIFTDMGQEKRTYEVPPLFKVASNTSFGNRSQPAFDPRDYRPLDVVLTLIMHDIQAHLIKNCNENDPPCPLVIIERFGVEMKKGYKETQLQVFLSPSMLLLNDCLERPSKEAHIAQGHLMLSGLQIRGHAMFSDEGRSLDEETVEYAWLIEMQLGKLSGKLSIPQTYHLITSLETLILLMLDDENELRSPEKFVQCVHNVPQENCANFRQINMENVQMYCPSADDIKYRMVRVAVDALDIVFVERDTAIHLWASPIRVSTCNLHGKNLSSRVTGLLPVIELRQFICAGNNHLNHSNTNTSSSSRSHHGSSYRTINDDTWLEIGSIVCGPLWIESFLSISHPELLALQQEFLKVHDEQTRRLWFLWPKQVSNSSDEKMVERCGCVGGCAFLGSNRNGPKFFKPTRQDIQDGINIAALRINESLDDPGFGQSILHPNQLVFHTPPYDSCQLSVQESFYYWDNMEKVKPRSNLKVKASTRDRSTIANPCPRSSSDAIRGSPGALSQNQRKTVRRRFSCTSASQTRQAGNFSPREVPYSRLDDQNPTSSTLPHVRRTIGLTALGSSQSKSILTVPEVDLQRRSSASDSRLLVDDNCTQKPESLPKLENEWATESRHSLTLPQDISLQQAYPQVTRTASITSENQSEAYFSADENMTSALASRHSIVGSLFCQDSHDVHHEKFRSESCIVQKSDPVAGGQVAAGSGQSNLLSHLSDREIHRHKIRHKGSLLSNERGFPELHEDQAQENILYDSSDEGSISSTSFISAVSSQEDIELVNLHMQINRPIVEAPLLMSSYIHHLPQVGCNNWSSCSVPSGCEAYSIPGSLFKKSTDGFLLYEGGFYTPHFRNVTEGFTYLRMMSRINGHVTPPTSCRTPTHPYSWESPGGCDMSDDISSDLSPNEAGVTSTIVRFQGDLDVIVTPLVLESLQRFIDSLTPTLTSLHPLTILNHLHFECIGRVKDANVLKREKYLNKFAGLSSLSVPDPAKGTKEKPLSKAVQLNVYQQSITSRIEGILHLPKINVTLLQAFIVEELTPFSALDNIRDFACVSVFATSFDKITAKINLDKQTREIVQVFQRPIMTEKRKKTGLLARSSSRAGNKITGQRDASTDPVFIESSEKQQSELTITLNIGKIHAQLRRLPNDCSILKDASVTSIPIQHSKVMFVCAKVSSLTRNGDVDPNVTRGEHEQDQLGFIMFEMGLEGVSLKIIKHEKFNKEPPPILPSVQETKEQEKEKHVLSQTEQFLTAMRFSSKTAATVNNFIESRHSKIKLTSKTSDPVVGTTAEEAKTSETKTDFEAGSGSGQPDTAGCPASPPDEQNASCVIHVATVWFNFAAPPPTPITRKIDYTRMDWNLLSTVSPAISAWMNPGSRFASRLINLLRCMYRRSCGVTACLMADALDARQIHNPIKSRYGRYTPLAKTLQEDPSCQLCNVLQKYVLLTDISVIEENLNDALLPDLTTLRQGIVALVRQWKNNLYTPLLLDHKYKTRHLKPLNVAVAFSDSDDEIGRLDGTSSTEDADVTDECAILIDTVNEPKAPIKVPVTITREVSPIKENGVSALTSPTIPSLPSAGRKKTLPHANPPSSSRASIVFPIGNTNHPFPESRIPMHDPQGQREDDIRQLGSNGSTFSNGQMPATKLYDQQGEDLYSWMAKQQEYVNEKYPQENVLESLPANNLPVEESVENPIESAGFNVHPVEPYDSLCLLEAHIIFQPLILSLGVMTPQMLNNQNENAAVFDTWGSSLSLLASMDTLRIDIIVSENDNTADRKKPKYKSKLEGKIHLELPSDMPAFICENVGIEVDVKKVADMAVDALYISRGQLKKHTVTRLNFLLKINEIAQQVNMPLLRLLHQIGTMYQNVKDTQLELREQEIANLRNAGLASKIPNGSSSTSEIPDQTSLLELSKSQNVTEPRVTLSPSVLLLTKPNLFDQKSGNGGYMSLNESTATPTVKGSQKNCWNKVLYLTNLYGTKPETKTVAHRFSVAPPDFNDKKRDTFDPKNLNDLEKGQPTERAASTSTPLPLDKPFDFKEQMRLVITGDARINRTRLLATLSGLKLEAEITQLNSTLSCKKKMHPETLETSMTGQVGRAMIVLLEGVPPNQQTVVKVTVGKSQTLYSSITSKAREKNSGFLVVGAVNVDIPQHPLVLHGMMTRGSKQLSTTLQELGVTRTSRLMRGMTIDETDMGQSGSSGIPMAGLAHSPRRAANVAAASTSDGHPTLKPTVSNAPDLEKSSLLQPLVMQFSIIVTSLSITAAILPSLKAQYKMDQVQSKGVTGNKAKFTINLPRHSLSFTTKLEAVEANLPSEASIELPPVFVSAEYIQDGKSANEAELGDGIILREGSYLRATADIGLFEHSLTTDLLNHLVFVQKVFMKEVNEVLQKVYGGEKVVPLWQEESQQSSSLKRLLFSLVIRIKRVQLTATTPTNSAVRLETGAVEFQLSNRVENVSGSTQPNPYMKIFGNAQVDINLSLGQLLKHALFEEAEPEFQQYAFFKTRIGLRNAFQGEMVQGEDKEVVLITLKRPLIYIQPIAVDKAIVVWLNYKNAYEYWNEQRSGLNNEVITATQQVFEKVPFGSSPHLGTLFLQLTVDDMGICLPLNPLPLTLNRSLYTENESRGAVIVTLESTIISACSSGSLVSKGRFVGLCLRFADDFETSLDDWKPDMNDSNIMNLCIVSEGTYEVCSRTIAQKGEDNAKWFLNVQWQMEGVDIHLDVNVGKQLSALGHTLTMLGSVEEDEVLSTDYDTDEADGSKASQESMLIRRSKTTIDNLPSFLLDPSLEAKTRSRLIEKEMQEQTKVINDLKSLGASHATVEQEIKRLRELESLLYKDFRRDMMQKLRRQSVKASSIKGKLGLGKNSAASFRSRSFIIPSPTQENIMDTELSPDEPGLPSRLVEASASFESSPVFSGPARTASLRLRERNLAKGAATRARVTFNDVPVHICRQSSLPSADSDDVSLGDIEWNSPSSDFTIVDGERVVLRRKQAASRDSFDDLDSLSDRYDTSSSANQSHYPTTTPKPQEPNIDFELDVKVFINSGKCVLHTKDSSKDEELRLTGRMKKERSCSGGMFEFPPSSPNMSRKSKESKQSQSSTRGRYYGTMAQLVDLTIFHIPGLDVKVHYESKIEPDDQGSPNKEKDGSFLSYPIVKKPGNKKASLFAWTTLQSIPEETIISPHILEFLEQTLEPIPNLPSKESFLATGHSVWDIDGDTTGNYVYASFPVDVMVYFHMEPSTFRFSCLPASRVECMLQLPSLDIVFSSKRAEGELNSEFSERFPEFTENLDSGFTTSAIGGLSVTGCLSNFSVHIFHPYGGGKKTGIKEAQWSPLADSERKDSLSINVEFVKFHLSRSRKINFQAEQTKGMDLGRAAIRFSTIIDIGSASFKYDMRRLTEILAFPKAWYRRTIVRRLFLGELNVSAMHSDCGPSSPSSTDEETTLLHHNERFSSDSHSSNRSPLMMAARDKLKLNLGGEYSRSRFKDGNRMDTLHESTPSPSEHGRPAWETLVLFAVNFTKLNVQMSMGNVMGNAMCLTKDFHSEGRLSIGSSGHKNLYIGFGLGGCSLDAKGGIVGGTIELNSINTFVSIKEDPGTEPCHKVGLKLSALELRLDYMGSSVLMTRVSDLFVSLCDEWKIRQFHFDHPFEESSKIFVSGDLGWDQLQMMISKSTTADLLKMYWKLDEFFSQQFQSSRRVLSSLEPRLQPRYGSIRKRAGLERRKEASKLDGWSSTSSNIENILFGPHAHWLRVVPAIIGLNIHNLKVPWKDTVVGGKMTLHGTNISLACFHGINFKAKSWALFSLRQPCISFITQAREISSDNEESEISVEVIQTLTFKLGETRQDEPLAQHNSMATICRMSRNVVFPPQCKTLQEWFHYAFAGSDIDAVDRFPSLEKEVSEETRRGRTGKFTEHNHTREVIFAFPSMLLNLSTEHVQVSLSVDSQREIDCSFTTEFDDHIFVTFDAEGFFFLHDLISSYVKEKEKISASQAGRAQSPDVDLKRDVTFVEDEKKRKIFDPSELLSRDLRIYNCSTWRLEPTVRLWSWAAKSIEPYGIDFILQKLGFAHARTTIPKWLQRGFMDPLDKILAVLVTHMISMVKDNATIQKKN